MNTATPVFVYGTLRTGLGNYQRILDGNTLHEEPATLAGATMRDAGGCPFVSLDGTGTVTGEVMYLDPETLAVTMSRLDRLESYFGPGNPKNMYDRVQVEVTLADGSIITAYTYVTGRSMRRWARDMPIIDSGDWKNRRVGDVRSVVTA